MIYPQTMLLRRSMGKWVRLTITSAGFALVGLWMVASGDSKGWLPLIFFGACFVVGLASLLPRASGLVIMQEGFGVRNLFRTRFYSWKEVDGFGVYHLRNHGIKVTALVGFNAHGIHRHRGAALSAALVGYTHGLPDTYGMTAEELAAGMNAYRMAAINDASNLPEVDE